MKRPLHIIKIGGHLIDQKKDFDQFISLFTELEGAKVLVHGGGNMATEVSKKLGV